MPHSQAQLAELSIGIERHLRDTLKLSCAMAADTPDEALRLAGAVTCLLMRHYYQACADPEGWLEGAVRSILQP